MRRLVHQVVDINPSISSFRDKLQEFFDMKSKDGWEYCGQVGLFHVFKRWENAPEVIEGTPYNGNGYGYQPYGGYGGQYRPTYQPQPYFNNAPYQSWGTRVNESNKSYPGEDD